MDESAFLTELEGVAQSLGVEVRYENLKKEGSFTPGGLCRLKGRYLLIVNSRAAARDKVEALALALNRFDLSQLYLKPGVREFLDQLPKDDLGPQLNAEPAPAVEGGPEDVAGE